MTNKRRPNTVLHITAYKYSHNSLHQISEICSWICSTGVASAYITTFHIAKTINHVKSLFINSKFEHISIQGPKGQSLQVKILKIILLMLLNTIYNKYQKEITKVLKN